MKGWIIKHFVYKTTNLVNGKYYIGKHSSSNIRGKYLGSGTALKSAIKKYGRHNFSREILKFFPTEELAYLYEAELITKASVDNSNCYNISIGGKGGTIPIKKTYIWNNKKYASKAKACQDLGVSKYRLNIALETGDMPEPIIKPFKFNGVEYKSLAEAGRDLGVSSQTVSNWLKKGLTHRPKSFILLGKEYYQISAASCELGISTYLVKDIVKNPQKYHGCFIIKGKRFLTRNKAAEFYKVYPQTISKWVKNPKKPDCFVIAV